tara:strand:+ start:206 stop:427 length:222 start_codon:yes stop_codon:yes gene_type:complete
MSRKKPTAMEIKKVLENLIMTVSSLENRLEGIAYTFIDYIDYKKDGKKFENFLKKRKETDVKQKNVRKDTNRK